MCKDDWREVRGLIDAFNKHRIEVVTPGPKLICDEAVSPWDGLEQKYHEAGCPHVTRIPRKPEDSGVELKCSADCGTGIMLQLEIQEGKEKMNRKEYVQAFGATTACTLRLVKPWFHTHRTVLGDSWFASVKTLVKLHEVGGLFFSGVVKTASREYPMQFLKDWGATVNLRTHRGTHKAVMSQYATHDGHQHNVWALGWADKKTLTFISNVGKTTDGEAARRRRYQKIQENGHFITRQHFKEVRRCHMVQNLFDGFSVIDIHDHYRQGSLGFHRSWKTQNWTHRLFSTILGIIITDAYFMYRFEYIADHYNDDGMQDFSTFLANLAHEMITHNAPSPVNLRQTKRKTTRGESKDDVKVSV